MALAGVGALTVAPYFLPASVDPGDIMHFIGAPASDGALGSGLAGALQKGLSHLPLLGSALTSTAPVGLPLIGTIASGALVSLAATAAIGIGGILLANWMHARETPEQFPWSKVVRYTALATSTLIALPSILGAISVGITFFASYFGPAAGSNTAWAMKDSLGATNLHATGAAGGLAALLPHFVACGAAAVPLVGAMVMGSPRNKPEAQIAGTVEKRRIEGRLQPLPALEPQRV